MPRSGRISVTHGPRGRAIAAAVALAAGAARGAVAADPPHPGLAVYRQHCVSCHGAEGEGTAQVPEPLRGERSPGQLAAYVDEAMPEHDPSLVTGQAARDVAEYIHAAFYSAVAQDRNRPARVELARLTARQYRETVADLLGSFGPRPPRIDAARGLRAAYGRRAEFRRSFDTGIADPVITRIDPQIDFDFGLEGPDPEQFQPHRFVISWEGSILPPETGRYEFVLRSEHAVRLFVNDDARPLIDAFVRSDTDRDHRASLFLLGGRAYPIRVQFAKFAQGVEDQVREALCRASIRLAWKPPHGIEETVPERCLVPTRVPETFVLGTPFPPDDRSMGYERGTSVSPEWHAAAVAAAVETASAVVAGVDRWLPAAARDRDRSAALRDLAARFESRATGRPLDEPDATAAADDRFASAADADTGLRRVVLQTLLSPRFLYRGSPTTRSPDAVAARMALVLWDSLPDDALRAAAAGGRLATPADAAAQANRMLDDPRTRAKLRAVLLAWLRVDQPPELVKDEAAFAAFDAGTAADLRTSFHLLLDDVLWDGPQAGDCRRLFTADEVFVNGRLAPLYGVDLPPDAAFQRVRIDAGRRAGILSHPYLMSVFAYAKETSPIHRGVFLARTVLGNPLKPPPEAVAPLAADVEPDLSTRERVALQTAAVSCRGCHVMINPLGFALEEFDAIGRHRTTERVGDRVRPIDATGGYQPRHGDAVEVRGAVELGGFVADSPDAHEAFVRSLFQALVGQPVRAWGPEALPRLVAAFAAHEFNVRHLLVDIVTMAAFPPSDTDSSSPPEIGP